MTRRIFIKVDDDVHRDWSILKTSAGKTWKEMLEFSFELLGTYYDKGMEAMVQRFERMRARDRVEEIAERKKQTARAHLPIKKII